MAQKSRTIVEEISQECIAVRLRVLHRSVTRVYNDELRPLGLTVSQMNILVTVSRMKSASQRTVSGMLHLEKSTLSRDLARLKAMDWIRETPDAKDARVRLLEVTAKGAKLLERAFPAWRRAQGRAREIMGAWQVQAAGRAADALSRKE